MQGLILVLYAAMVLGGIMVIITAGYSVRALKDDNRDNDAAGRWAMAIDIGATIGIVMGCVEN